MNALKIAFLVLLAVAASALFFFLAASSVARGYVAAGRGGAIVYTFAESPVAFSLSVGIMFAFAAVMLAGAVSMIIAPKKKRESLLLLAQQSVFGVRSGVRWLLAAVVVVLGALTITAIFRA
jgi:hypothetical protein